MRADGGESRRQAWCMGDSDIPSSRRSARPDFFPTMAAATVVAAGRGSLLYMDLSSAMLRYPQPRMRIRRDVADVNVRWLCRSSKISGMVETRSIQSRLTIYHKMAFWVERGRGTSAAAVAVSPADRMCDVSLRLGPCAVLTPPQHQPEL